VQQTEAGGAERRVPAYLVVGEGVYLRHGCCGWYEACEA